YFHDGRFDTFDQVVAHFDRIFALALTDQERSDLVAYLTSVGDGEQPTEPDPLGAAIAEITDFSSTLDTAITARNLPVIDLVVDTIGGELRELIEWFPDRRDAAATGGWEERRLARSVLKQLVVGLRRLAVASQDSKFDAAAEEYRMFSDLM